LARLGFGTEGFKHEEAVRLWRMTGVSRPINGAHVSVRPVDGDVGGRGIVIVRYLSLSDSRLKLYVPSDQGSKW
jgi:hypothetical protein